MELELRRQTVPSFETILEETVEQPVECDALLPDYCPDIRRILKCTLTPVPVGKTITAGRLEVEGLATLNILYISAGGEPARGEYKVPFTRMLELHGEAEDPIITVGMLPGPVSCRAVNQRRLEIGGRFGFGHQLPWAADLGRQRGKNHPAAHGPAKGHPPQRRL